MNPQDLISTLKAQHRSLKAELALALSNLESGEEDKIPSNLAKFKNDLEEHLKLENVEFYPDYLNKKAKRRESLTSTKEFIYQMEVIGKAVMSFIDKYTIPGAIDAHLLDFTDELSKITQALNVRIETEEEGVFDIYLSM